MKRTILITLGFLLLAATSAQAGWTDTIRDYTISGGITVLFAIIAAVFGKKYMAFKAPIIALLDVFAEYRRGKLLQSEEGKDLSKAEWNAIFAKMTLAVEAVVAAMPASWLPKREG
jgi:predicted DNA-binding protein (MmcQ/YjbR family)